MFSPLIKFKNIFWPLFCHFFFFFVYDLFILFCKVLLFRGLFSVFWPIIRPSGNRCCVGSWQSSKLTGRASLCRDTQNAYDITDNKNFVFLHTVPLCNRRACNENEKVLEKALVVSSKKNNLM
jgi:hypothetical protein